MLLLMMAHEQPPTKGCTCCWLAALSQNWLGKSTVLDALQLTLLRIFLSNAARRRDDHALLSGLFGDEME